MLSAVSPLRKLHEAQSSVPHISDLILGDFVAVFDEFHRALESVIYHPSFVDVFNAIFNTGIVAVRILASSDRASL